MKTLYHNNAFMNNVFYGNYKERFKIGYACGDHSIELKSV